MKLADFGEMHRKLRGLILDIDGTLVESNEAHALAWVRSLHEHGHRYSLDEVFPKIGMGADHLLPTLAGISSESEEGKNLSHRKNEIFKSEYLPFLQPTPGAKELLVRLKTLGLQLGVATSANEEELESLLKVCDASFLIPEKTSKTEAKKSKPSPNSVEITLKKLGTYPSETLMVGDTSYDIEAALKAGIQTVAFRCGGRTDKELSGAIAIFDHPLDLLVNLEASPLASALVSSGRAA